MKKNEKLLERDLATEEKIKIVAEKLFMEKGFSGTRTRDIAEAADINLALLNYYYRSKENLFNIIVMEKMDTVFNLLIDILNDSTTTFEKKIELLVHKYFDLMTKNPKLPFFLMSAVQQNPDLFAKKINIKDRVADMQYHFISQEHEIQFMLDIFSVIIFPFVIRNIIEIIYYLDESTYDELMIKRKERLLDMLQECYLKFKAK